MSEWKYKRTPLANDRLEALRVDDYWQWLADQKVENTAQAVGEKEGFTWVKLNNSRDADYEAKYMEHSIGYSWSKYSGIGPIYSMRENGIPKVTILVHNNVVVHAKEERNASLSKHNMAKLRSFSAAQGWTVMEEPRSFDCYLSDEPNIRIRLMLRTQPKKFEDVVLSGRINEQQVDMFEDNLPSKPIVRKEWLADFAAQIPFANNSAESFEVSSISSTSEPVSLGWEQIKSKDFLQNIIKAVKTSENSVSIKL